MKGHKVGRQTNTARRREHELNAREKAAAARVAAARRARRRRVAVIVGSAVGVLAVIGVIVAIGVSKSSKPADRSRPEASAAVVAAVTGVPQSTLDTIGAGTVTATPKPVSDPPLTAGGKPSVLYIGAEFCPYCAAERWPLVQALSRFGTFSGLKTTHSSPTDVFPNTSSFSFVATGYTSDVVAFTGKELETVTGAPLDQPTAAENALWKKYTGRGSFPFLDIAGKYVITGPSYDPTVLKGLTPEQIAEQLADPSSAVARAVDGAANVLTAAICKSTGNKPTSVCTAAGVTTAANKLGG